MFPFGVYKVGIGISFNPRYST